MIWDSGFRTNAPQVYATKDRDGILVPNHITEQNWVLHRQPRDALTFELHLRRWTEAW